MRHHEPSKPEVIGSLFLWLAPENSNLRPTAPTSPPSPASSGHHAGPTGLLRPFWREQYPIMRDYANRSAARPPRRISPRRLPFAPAEKSLSAGALSCAACQPTTIHGHVHEHVSRCSRRHTSTSHGSQAESRARDGQKASRAEAPEYTEADFSLCRIASSEKALQIITPIVKAGQLTESRTVISRRNAVLYGTR